LSHAEPLEWHRGEMADIIEGPRFGLQEPAYREYIARHCLGLGPGMSMADVGCGTAGSTLVLAPYVLPGGRVCGFDRDPDVLALAAENAVAAGVSDSLEFCVGDAGRIPAADDTFDVTWCQTVLMHVPDPQAAVDEMIRITKPRGIVAATEPDWTTATVWHLSATEPRTPDAAGLWGYAYACIMEGGRRRTAGDWGVGSRVSMLFRARGVERVRTRSVPATWTVAPRHDGRKSDKALHMTLALFYPEEGTALHAQQHDNFLAGGGSEHDWQRFQAVRGKELAAILLDHEEDHAILQVHCPAFLTVGFAPVTSGIKTNGVGNDTYDEGVPIIETLANGSDLLADVVCH
jgi:SAM-dependent methyltransferase